MSRQIQVRQHHTNESGFAISAINKLHVRKQISIRCNKIEHWVHLKCVGIRQAQYTDTWNRHFHIESRPTSHTDITPPYTSRPWFNPLPTPHTTTTQTHIQHSPCSERIGKAQTQSSHLLTPLSTHATEPNTYTSHTLHQHLSFIARELR